MTLVMQMCDPWTWTEWTWNTIKKIIQITIPNNFIWIKNYREFLEKYKTKKWKIHWSYKNIEDKLKIIGEWLKQEYWKSIDPIEYLIFLYYNEKISADDVANRIKSKYGIDFGERKNFWRILSNTLWWELRQNNEETPTKLKKDKIKAKKLDHHIKRKKETKDEIDKILWLSSWKFFSEKEFERKKTKREKLIYIFWAFWIIEEEKEKNFKNFLVHLKYKWFWARRIIQIIESILQECSQTTIKIDTKEIYQWSQE